MARVTAAAIAEARPPALRGAASGAARCALAAPPGAVLVSSWLEWILLDPIGLEGERAGVGLSCGGSSHCHAGRNCGGPPPPPHGPRDMSRTKRPTPRQPRGGGLEALPCTPQLRGPTHPPSGGAASGAARCALAVPSKPVLVSSRLGWTPLGTVGL